MTIDLCGAPVSNQNLLELIEEFLCPLFVLQINSVQIHHHHQIFILQFLYVAQGGELMLLASNFPHNTPVRGIGLIGSNWPQITQLAFTPKGRLDFYFLAQYLNRYTRLALEPLWGVSVCRILPVSSFALSSVLLYKSTCCSFQNIK